MKRKTIRICMMSLLVSLLVLLPIQPIMVKAFTEPSIDTFVTLDVSFSAISFYGEISSNIMDSHIDKVTVHLNNVPSTPYGYVLDKKIVVPEGSYDSFTVVYSGLGSDKDYRGWVEITFDNGLDPKKSTIRDVTTNLLPSVTSQVISNIQMTTADYSVYIRPNGSKLANTGCRVYEDGNPTSVFGRVFSYNFSYNATFKGTITGLDPGTHYNLIHYVTGFDGDKHDYASIGFETKPAPTPTPAPTATPTASPMPTQTPVPTPTKAPTQTTASETTVTETFAETEETTVAVKTGTETEPLGTTVANEFETTVETSSTPDSGSQQNGDDLSNILLLVLLSIIAAALVALVVLRIVRNPAKKDHE